jgi:hypothetical protein
MVTSMTESRTSTEAPAALRAWVEDHARVDAIDNHGFSLNLGLWNRQIGHLPGAPVTGSHGETDKGRISRRDLFDLATEARDDESGVSALQLYWRTLVWGTGTAHRNTPGRIRSVEADAESAGRLLRAAAQKTASDSQTAFLLLRPGGNALKSLGPNFFTKFLYFAGGGAVDHPCLIVDKRVLRSLHRETQMNVFAPRTTNYSVGVYEHALATMQSWAQELTTADRRVGADEVERWAFSTGGTKQAAP